jgi:hypothetical protein
LDPNVNGAVRVAPEAAIAPVTLRLALLTHTMLSASEKTMLSEFDVALMVKFPGPDEILPLLAMMIELMYPVFQLLEGPPRLNTSFETGETLDLKAPVRKSPVSLEVGI